MHRPLTSAFVVWSTSRHVYSVQGFRKVQIPYTDFWALPGFTQGDVFQGLRPLDSGPSALELRADRQAADKSRAAGAWQDPELVFTSICGTPYEPRNFNRQFANRCRKAGVRYIRVHDTRRTCASLLVALDVHPRVAMQILGTARSP